MCLIISNYSQDNFKKASKAIKVYKVLTTDNKAPYYSQYVYSPGYNIAAGPEEASHYSGGLYAPELMVIEGGFLHAYNDKERAIEQMARIKELINTLYPDKFTQIAWNAELKLVEMEIPEGEMYYEDRIHHEVATKTLVWRPKEDED
jgi:hypothetical protein